MEITKTSKEIVKQYYESLNVNQSTLKKVYTDIFNYTNTTNFKLYYEESSKGLIIGSVVDCIITMSSEEFEEQFYISTLEKKPSDKLISIYHHVFDRLPEEYTEEELKVLIINSAKYHEYYPNWKDEKLYETIIKYKSYLLELIDAKNKQIITQEEYNLCNTIADNIKNKLYSVINNSPDDKSELKFQVPIYFNFKDSLLHNIGIDTDEIDIECKSLLDVIYINHDEKRITPIDIKTTFNKTIDFETAFYTYDYGIQATMYTIALNAYKKQNNLEDYFIEPFIFIVESTKYNNKNECLAIQLNNDLLYSIMYTNTYKYNKYSLIDLVRRYKYHVTYGFDHSYLYSKNDGFVKLTSNGLEV